MLRSLSSRQNALRKLHFSTSSRLLSSPAGLGLYEIAGAKHDVARAKTRGGSDEPLSFLGGGKLAHLADGSGVCAHGGSVVHAAVTTAENLDATDDFLPLTVDYRSRAYAFGRIPSVHNRRERHGNNDDEVLISRIIDRAVRPLFPKGLTNHVQLVATTHAADSVHDPTIVSVNAASLALLRSSVEWKGPVGCVRVGMGADGKLLLNPTVEQMQTSALDLVYAGTHERTLMLECVGSEVPEAVLGAALDLAQQGVKAVIDTQLKMIAVEQAHTNSQGGATVPVMITAKMRKKLLALEGVGSGDIAKMTPAEAHAMLLSRDGGGGGGGGDSAMAKDTSSVTSAPTSSSAPVPGLHIVPQELQDDLEIFGLARSVDMFSSCAGLSRKDRGLQENGIQTLLKEHLRDSVKWADAPAIVRRMAVERCMKKAFRAAVLGRDLRVDGRAFDQVREVMAYADVLPSVHGSSFFGRGDTHVLSTATLGALSDAKVTVPLDGSSGGADDGLLRAISTSVKQQQQQQLQGAAAVTGGGSGERRHIFYLHYDFPPYCTGVVGNAGAVNRRMVGHGNLAERALRPVMPDASQFPYTVRAFAECTSSSGSSSMASACSATLAMLDAGVPLKASVAGVSIGLVTARPGDPTSAQVLTDADTDTKYRLLTDILGTEDHYGDMDFKIAGTTAGVTAMQLDMKLEQGLPVAVLKQALDRARDGRLHLLDRMGTAMSAPREAVKSTAPAAQVVAYNPERKRLLIGPGGEMVRYIEDTYQCSVDTSEEGVAYVFGADRHNVAQATDLVQDIVTVLEPGQILTGEVMDIKDFGVFVKLTRSQEAILHLSEISHDPVVLKRPLEQSIAVGQRVSVQVLSVDKGTGAVRVSRKALLDASQSDNLDAAPARDVVEGRDPPAGSVRDPLPTFPVMPPRKWSKDYFRIKVASEAEVEAARKNGGAPQSSASSSSSSFHAGGKRGGHARRKDSSSGGSRDRRDDGRKRAPRGKETVVDLQDIVGIVAKGQSPKGEVRKGGRERGVGTTSSRSSSTGPGDKSTGGHKAASPGSRPSSTGPSAPAQQQQQVQGGIIQSFLNFVGMGSPSPRQQLQQEEGGRRSGGGGGGGSGKNRTYNSKQREGGGGKPPHKFSGGGGGNRKYIKKQGEGKPRSRSSSSRSPAPTAPSSPKE